MKKLTLSLKIAAGYLVLSGAVDLIWPLTGLGPHHAEFQVKSLAYKFGAYFREMLFAALFVISGLGLLCRRSWARKLALAMIALGSICSINSFAWGLAKGTPSLNAYAASTAIIGLWNAFWFYLIYKNKDEVFIDTSDDQQLPSAG